MMDGLCGPFAAQPSLVDLTDKMLSVEHPYSTCQIDGIETEVTLKRGTEKTKTVSLFESIKVLLLKLYRPVV